MVVPVRVTLSDSSLRVSRTAQLPDDDFLRAALLDMGKSIDQTIQFFEPVTNCDRFRVVLRHFPSDNTEERRHGLLLRALVRRCRLFAMLVRLLLVAVVLELLSAN